MIAMDIFYKKGIKYFSIAALTITIFKLLGISSGMTEKEAMYYLLQSKGNYFYFTYEPYQIIVAVFAFSFSVWLFLFFINIDIKRRKK